MRFWLWISLALAAGCSAPAPAAKAPAQAPPPAAPERLPAPPSGQESPDLWLTGPNGRTVAPGDLRGGLESAFPRPARSLPIRALPSRLPQTLEVQGWQLGEESVGALVQEGRIGLILKVVEADQPYFEDGLRELKSLFGAPDATAGEPGSQALFWERSGLRLMLSAVRNPSGVWIVGESVGSLPWMDRLGMSPAHFAEEAVQAKQFQAAQEADRDSGTS